ncbi:MAG TPA: tetratricopeptide repeat protein [Pyrinomonadaceae bacterium]|nr:tetratricopeptide repeat protein [Pyrinomonadaceae bacterium]
MTNTKGPQLIALIALFLITTQTFAQGPGKTVEDYVAAGIAAQKVGKCEEALQQYVKVIKLDPKNFVAQFNSGRCYLELQKAEQALTFFKIAVGLKPFDALAQYALGNAYGVTGHMPEAIDAFKESVRLDPKLIHAHRALAGAYELSGKNDDAIREHLVVLQLKENDPASLYFLGRLYVQTGSFTTAIEYFNRSIAVKPTADAYLGLGLAQAKVSDYLSSILAYNEAIKLEPSNELAQYNLGLSLRQVGRHADAAAAFKRATELKTDWAQPFLYLGMSYEDLGDSEKFLVAEQQANRINPNDLGILKALGTALRANRKYIDAIEPLKKVSTSHPDDVDDLYLLGNTYLMAGRYDDAIKTLNRVLVLQPSHEEARERLRVASARKNLLPTVDDLKRRVLEDPLNASLRAELGQTYNSLAMNAEAEQEYLKAVELDPKNSDFHGRLCVNYSEWDKFDKAVECYKEAVKKDANHVYYMSLGDVYQNQGKLDEAIAAYQKSLEKKPTFTFSLYKLAYAYMKKGEPQNAIEPLRKMLAVEPNNTFGNHALGIAYAQTGNNDGAMQQYYILQSINPRLAADLLRQIPK